MGTLTSKWHKTIIQGNTHMLSSMKPHVYSAAVRSRIGICDMKDAEGMITQLSRSDLELVQTDVQ